MTIRNQYQVISYAEYALQITENLKQSKNQKILFYYELQIDNALGVYQKIVTNPFFYLFYSGEERLYIQITISNIKKYRENNPVVYRPYNGKKTDDFLKLINQTLSN